MIRILLGLLMGVIIVTFPVYSDTNGVWIDAKDIRGGTFGSDEGDPDFEFTRLGIGGSPSSQHLLEVDGNINSNQLCIDGDCLGRWNWKNQGSDTYYTQGSIGVGLTNPSYAIDFREDDSNNYVARIENTQRDSRALIGGYYGINARSSVGGNFIDKESGTQTRISDGEFSVTGDGILDGSSLNVDGEVRGSEICIDGDCLGRWNWKNQGSDTYYTQGSIGVGLTNPSYAIDFREDDSNSYVARIENTQRDSRAFIGGYYGINARSSVGGNFVDKESGTQTRISDGDYSVIGDGKIRGSSLNVDGEVEGNEICIDGNCIDEWMENIWSLNSDNDAYYMNGSVGIGNSNPDYKLDVQDFAWNGYVSQFENSNSGSVARIAGYNGIFAEGNRGGYFKDSTSGTYSIIADGNNGITTNGKIRSYDDIIANGDIRSYGKIEGDEFCANGLCKGDVPGPWEKVSKTYELDAPNSQCSGDFTDWNSEYIDLPAYSQSIDVQVTDVHRDVTFNNVEDYTYMHVLAYQGGQWERIGYDGKNCRPDGDTGTWCGWGDEDPGNHYENPDLPSANQIKVSIVGYCKKNDATSKGEFTIEYLKPVEKKYDTNNYDPQ